MSPARAKLKASAGGYKNAVRIGSFMRQVAGQGASTANTNEEHWTVPSR